MLQGVTLYAAAWGFWGGGGGCSLSRGQPHAEVCAASSGLENLDGAAVGHDEFRHHRQADSRALDMPSLRCFSLIKSLEYSLAFVGRNPGPAVHDIQYQLFALAAHVNRNGAAARSEFDGVRQ